MPKYIDADALLAEAKRLSGPMTGDGWDNWGVYALIERQPAADVKPVIKCRECKYAMLTFWVGIVNLPGDFRKRKFDGFGECLGWLLGESEDE